MRFLIAILAVAVMALTGCDLELGSAGDQYNVTFNVVDGAQGVVYKKGETSYGDVPVFLYTTSPATSGTLIASESGVALATDGTLDGGTTGDYFFLEFSGNSIDLGTSKVRYQGISYSSLSEASVSDPPDGNTTVTGVIVSITLDDGVNPTVRISGKFSALGVDTDGT